MLSRKITFRVRYAETDQMGVVYHGNYAQYLEMGRIAWLRSFGLSYREMEENGIMLPVIQLQLNFKKSALFDDELTLETSLKELPTVRIAFGYSLTNQHQEIVATGSTDLVFMDVNRKRPMRCPEYILKKLR
ncbi:acyl-CoA thioesterase [Maribacter sp. 2307ULW6-5]|uniref:acyl-CoA thioesterase n=1 Tax=Maribacter sp. 2307ULW6-5 TaxID=3386275 RepID=UPI0039BC933C